MTEKSTLIPVLAEEHVGQSCVQCLPCFVVTGFTDNTGFLCSHAWRESAQRQEGRSDGGAGGTEAGRAGGPKG